MNQSIMSEAPMPFRPRPENPVDRALARIGTQAREVRQRANRFALADLAFVAGGAAILAWAVLVLLALRLTPHGFALAAWAVLAAVVVIGWTRLRVVRRTWMPAARAAIVIDERAHLEERLSTLTAATESSRQSRLWDFLLRENLRLLPAWEGHRLTPRAVPRTVWFFAIALVALMLAQRRLPHGIEGSSDSAQPGFVPPADEGSEDDSEHGPDAPQQSSFGFTLPEALRQAILGKQSSQTFAGKNPEKTVPVKEDRGGPAIVGERPITNGGPVRSMPAGPNAPKPSGPPGAGANVPAASDGKPSTEPPPPSRIARGDAPKRLSPAESGKPQAGQNKTTASKTTAGGSGGGAGRGGDVDGLYGEKQGSGKYSGSFSLDLDALQSGDPSDSGDAGEPTRPETRLSSEQRLDDAIRRAQVPVDYEKIVQRIFNRAAEDETSRP
jgi:hypothetical protein